MRTRAFCTLAMPLLLCASYSFADTSLDTRKAAVLKLHAKYPCDKFDKAIRPVCDLYQTSMLLDATLKESEANWKKGFKEHEESFLSWQDSEGRARNKIKPKIGMNTNYVYRHVMGPPDSINETETAQGVRSQWVYKTESGTQYFYFNSEGVLTTIQKRR